MLLNRVASSNSPRPYDNPDQVERLITRLTAVLPLPAGITAEPAAALQTEKPA
jgi:hypothetical protein